MSDTNITRQTFLQRSLQAGTWWVLPASITGCSLFDDAELKLGELAELERQIPYLTYFNRKKILLTRLDGAWVVFSLICRHKACTVAWKSRFQQFVCPCHEGTYNAQGEVVDGPPPGPLRRFKWEIRDGSFWVRNEYA